VKSTRPIILNDEVRELPDHAGAAMSNRAIARMLDILPHTGAERWPHEATELMNRLVAQLEIIATTTDLGPSAFVLGHNGYKESQQILEVFEGGSYNRVAWLCVQAAMTASGSGGQSSYSWCAHLTWDITPKPDSRQATRIVENANWDDFKQIRLAYESGELTDSTPIHPDDLGPLWPKGPADWSGFEWKDLEAERLEQERATKEHEELRERVLGSLVARSELLKQPIIDAIDNISRFHGGKYRQGFWAEAEQPTQKWPAALRHPSSPFLQDLQDLFSVHEWGGLLILEGQLDASVWFVAPTDMSAAKKMLLEWDSALDCFDPEAIEETNRISESNGWEADAKLAPCSKRDFLVFATVHESPDSFLVVTKGSVAGKVFYFDHETGIDFDQPIADSLAGWIHTIADPSHDWLWFEE